MTIRIGSRKSKLAVVQVEEILNLLQEKGKTVDNFEHTAFDTAGDINLTSSLKSNVGDDFFTDTLDQALLSGKIDCAVHSAKDLPKKLHPDIEIIALTDSLDETDAWVGRYSWYDLPKGAKIGTSSSLRSQQSKLEHPDAELVDIRGTIQDRLELITQGVVDGIIVATCALKRLSLQQRITTILPWDGFSLQGQLAVTAKKGADKLKQIFSSIDARKLYGKAWLVGAGPGDPDLITKKAIYALQQADCVLYDFLTDESLLNYAPSAEHIYVGKRKGDHCMPQQELCRLLRDKVRQGKKVVRLKGGDPFIFGRGAEEFQYLKDYLLDVDFIPGVNSATGIATTLGLPLTARNISSSVGFITGHSKNECDEIREIKFPDTDTIVVFMGLTKLPQIVDGLLKQGRDKSTPVLIVSNGTRPDQKILKGTLETIVELSQSAKPSQPSIIYIGETINLMDHD